MCPIISNCHSWLCTTQLPHHFSLILFSFCLLFHVPSHVSRLICCCFPPPSTPRSASCGLNVAPAHTSARHEAVRVWLESVSGGSADLKGIAASHLSLNPLGLLLQHAQTHSRALTSMLAAAFASTLRSQVLTSSLVFSPNLLLSLHFWANAHPPLTYWGYFEQTGINGMAIIYISSRCLCLCNAAIFNSFGSEAK